VHQEWTSLAVALGRNERQYSVRPVGPNSLKGGAVCRVRPRAVVAMQHSCRYCVTVVEQFHGYAHHSVLSRCMLTNSG
jgi:hypothetical protein